MRRLAATLLLTAALPAANAQLGEINLLTDLGTPFPPGCLSIQVPEQPRPGNVLLVNSDVPMPSLNSTTRDELVNIRIWRVACADDGYSVLVVRMQQLDDRGPPVLVPQVFADSGDVAEPDHVAQLLKVPASGFVGATGNTISPAGTSWMLAVDPIAISDFTDPDPQPSFFPSDYNEFMTIEFNWGSYSSASSAGVRFLLDRFEPTVDPPQFDDPVLNGRFSGQWVRAGAPRQGLVLQIAEQVDSNYVFAIFFTYLGGQPVWVVGNSTPALAEPGPVTIAMNTLENGAFITSPNQPEPDDVPVDDAGTITLSVVDCNRIRVDYDFAPLGQGSGTMTLERLIRIGGYDCNPWE